MLIDYDTLCKELAPEILANLIKEYLFSQVSDEGFEQLSVSKLSKAIEAVKQALQKGELVVEYSEVNHSVSIKAKHDLIATKKPSQASDQP